MKRNTDGSYTVEAAVFLPVFLLAVLTIGFLIRVSAGAESCMHAASDELRLAAANAYVANVSLGLSSNIENRMEDEDRSISGARVTDLRYLMSDGEIALKMKYHIDIPFAVGVYNGVDLTDRLKARAWIGRSNEDPLGYDAMEQEADSETVYIFPAWGEKYHKKECTYVTADPVQMSLTSEVKSKYHACPRCRSGELSEGAVVYCFPQYGEAYHRPGCDSIVKFTVAIQKDQAERRGYTPCSKCGG